MATPSFVAGTESYQEHFDRLMRAELDRARALKQMQYQELLSNEYRESSERFDRLTRDVLTLATKPSPLTKPIIMTTEQLNGRIEIYQATADDASKPSGERVAALAEVERLTAQRDKPLIPADLREKLVKSCVLTWDILEEAAKVTTQELDMSTGVELSDALFERVLKAQGL